LLTFLAIACKQKFVLDSYGDEPIGYMEKNAEGKMAITRVELHPKYLAGRKMTKRDGTRTTYRLPPNL